MRRAALWCGAVLAALLVAAASAVALVVFRPQLVRPWVVRALTPRGGAASLSELKLSISPAVLELSGLSIEGPPPEGDLLRLDRLKVEVIPDRLLRGGPWLRRVEAAGLAFERPRPREGGGPPDLSPLKRLFDIEELSLSDARLHVAFPQDEIAVEAIRFRMAPAEGGTRSFSGAGKLVFLRMGRVVAEGELLAEGAVTPAPEIGGMLELRPARLALPQLAGELSGRSGLRVTPEILRAEGLTLTLREGRFAAGPQAQGTAVPGTIRLTASAEATLKGGEPRIDVAEFDVGGLLLARGKLEGPTLEELSGTFSVDIPRVERLIAALSRHLPETMKGVNLAGALPCRVDLSTRGAERVLALELLPRDLRVSWPEGGIGARFGGSLRAEGPLQGWVGGKPALSGRIEGTGDFRRKPVAVRRFRFEAPLAGTLSAPAVPGWNLSAGAGEVTWDGRPLPLGAMAVSGSVKPVDGSYRLDGLDIRSGSLGRATGELAFRGGGVAGRLNGADLPVDKLVSLAQALSGKKWASWSPGGAVGLSSRIEPAKGGGHRIATAVQLGKITFSSPSGDVMGQGLEGTLNLETVLSRQPRAKADLALRRGEALWKTVYVDFAKDPLDLQAMGTRKGPEEYADLSMAAAWGGFGRASAEGTARRSGGAWRHQGRMALDDARLGPIFRTFLKDPLSASHPDLASMETDGIAALDLSFSGSGKKADLAGTLRVSSAAVRQGKEPPMVEGFDIALPVAYSLGSQNPARPKPADASKWGRLRLKKLRLAGQELGPLEMPAVLVPNNLYLEGAIDASLLGAALSFRRIRVEEPLSPDFRIHMAARLDGLDFARVSGDNSILEGSLGGLLDPVSIGRERMTASGELSGRLYGGRLDIRNVTVERPFGAGREIGADVRVDLLDLERFSEAAGVGRITGRLSGVAEGLRVAYGQPVAFHLRMESVPVDGVDQLVSLKAVNSISTVSTGAGVSGLGTSLMAKFFREFPYEKIGFECGLKNDVFTVRGLILEDGVEYLVKRRVFSGINVINRNRDNRIGFSDMVERAKRVTRDRPDGGG